MVRADPIRPGLIDILHARGFDARPIDAADPNGPRVIYRVRDGKPIGEMTPEQVSQWIEDGFPDPIDGCPHT